MTTTTDSRIDLQNSVQSPPQEQAQTNPPPPASDTNDMDIGAQRRRLCALSKMFGNIPNVPIFAGWEKRVDCSNSAVHRPIMAGICGNRKYGVYSIAMSSSYKDDEDGGDVIIYTGAGGRKRWSDSDPPKRLRLGPQTMDQSWDDPPNRALKISFFTGNPVRVIRSWKCPSQYAPINGYRYDGLYRVAAHWTAKGGNGKNICRCRLERLPNQPPIPVRPLTFSTSKKRHRERFVSRLTCSPLPSPNSYDTPDETGFDIGPNHPNPSTTHLAGSTGRESEGLSNPPQQRAMPETSAGIDFNMGEVDFDVKDTQPLPPQGRVSPNPGALPRYRWDRKKCELVKLPASHPIPADFDTAEGDEEECRGEDDATLVPSEDGHVSMPANERTGTEYFSDRGNSPRPGTPDEPRASGSSVLENQRDH